ALTAGRRSWIVPGTNSLNCCAGRATRDARMPITFNCPGCGEALQVADEFAGRQALCPYCKAAAVIPEAAPPPPPKEAGPTDWGFANPHNEAAPRQAGFDWGKAEQETRPAPVEPGWGLVRTGLLLMILSSLISTVLTLCGGVCLGGGRCAPSFR